MSEHQYHALCDGAGAMKQASEGLTKLHTLVLSCLSWNIAWQPAYEKEVSLQVVFDGRARAVTGKACGSRFTACERRVVTCCCV